MVGGAAHRRASFYQLTPTFTEQSEWRIVATSPHNEFAVPDTPIFDTVEEAAAWLADHAEDLL